MDVHILPIRREQVDAVARLHLETFPEAETTRLGYRYVRAFFDWFSSGEKRLALAASVGEALCGYVVGAPLEDRRPMYAHLLWAAAGSMVCRPWVVLSRGVRQMAWARLALVLRPQGIVNTVPTLPHPVMVLETIGVSPAWQRRGIGDRLLRAFEHEARAQGMRALLLAVQKDNAPARRLYAQRGWIVGPSTGLERFWYYLPLS